MSLTAGTRLGPYQIEQKLGAGGMGEVYRARDTRLERTVAVKVLAPAIVADPAFRARFEREARLISALSHPHICVLHDVGLEGDVNYVVLEHLQGETLADRLGKHPYGLKLSDVLGIAIAVADALDAAHRRGIVHRDLKPGNVMLTSAGPKLLAFGLAKQSGGSSAALSMLATQPGTGTAQGVIVGTLQYMAPEQIQGQQVDARTDLFAFGAVIYEMVTGRKAFEAQTQASVIAKVLETDPPALSTLAPTLAAPHRRSHLSIRNAVTPSIAFRTSSQTIDRSSSRCSDEIPDFTLARLSRAPRSSSLQRRARAQL